MRNKQFEVPAGRMLEFAEIIEANELTASIEGTKSEDLILVNVPYERTDHSAIMELIEMLDDEQEEEDEQP